MAEAELTLRNLDHLVFKEYGIKFKTAPVSGHHYHGSVERKIKSIQECLDRVGVDKMRLHATGYQTLMKLIENELNNIPMGFGYGRQSDNSPLMKLIFPNLLRHGRNNSRSLSGPIKLASGSKEMMSKIEESYKIFFNLLNTVIIPKWIKAQKVYKETDPLAAGDVVYFQKDEGALSSSWNVGKIKEVIVSRDGHVRRAIVEYHNPSENQNRETDRAVKSLIKLFNIDDGDWGKEVDSVEKMLKHFEDDAASDQEYTSETVGDLKIKLKKKPALVSVEDENYKIGMKLDKWLENKKCNCKKCCCSSHCKIRPHGQVVSKDVPSLNTKVDVPTILDKSWQTREEFMEEQINLPLKSESFLSLLCAVNMDLGSEEDEDL